MKVIKTQEEYDNALDNLDKLIQIDPKVGTPLADELELLSVIIQEYEARSFPIGLPDPIEALKFRMEQQGLTQRDLVPYLGSRSRVSEVLARKRPLTLSMIRALHTGLGIPAEVLLKGGNPTSVGDTDIDWDQFPLRDMMARGWIKAPRVNNDEEAREILRRFFAPLSQATLKAVLTRKSEHVRAARTFDFYALMAWSARVMLLANEEAMETPYTGVTLDLMREVGKLSWFESGPVLAREALRKNGISLIVERHLPHTQLDGAALLIVADRPVIGLTLRYDRIDSFWFTLMHELAHLKLHFSAERQQFYDDLDVDRPSDQVEIEADRLAREMLIPEEVWHSSPARVARHVDAVQSLANKLRIHPALVAGRIRFETKDYRLLNQLVGHGQVRKHFPEVSWGEAT